MRIKKAINSQNISISEVGWIDDIFSLRMSRPVQLSCLASIPVQRAFLHSIHEQVGERPKKLTKLRVVGRTKGCLPTNPSILQKALHLRTRLLIVAALSCS